MPYRRLPNTDNARIKAMKRAHELGTDLPPFKLAFSQGIFQKIKFCELSKVTDIEAPSAGLLGLLGLSDIVFTTKDADQPVIRIRGIKNREQVLEKIFPAWRRVKVDRRGYFWE